MVDFTFRLISTVSSVSDMFDSRWKKLKLKIVHNKPIKHGHSQLLIDTLANGGVVIASLWAMKIKVRVN